MIEFKAAVLRQQEIVRQAAPTAFPTSIVTPTALVATAMVQSDEMTATTTAMQSEERLSH